MAGNGLHFAGLNRIDDRGQAVLRFLELPHRGVRRYHGSSLLFSLVGQSSQIFEMTTMTLAILIEPLDLLFCRDGRPIVAGEGAAAGTALPGPQVLAGAIRTALLRQRGQLPTDGSRPAQAHLDAVLQVRLRGPLLADLARGQPLIPMPADLAGDKAKHGLCGTPQARLRPQSGVPGWQAPADAPQALPLWPAPERASKASTPNDRARPAELAAQSGFLTWDGFQAWAAGRLPNSDQVRSAETLWAVEARTNVSLDAATAVAAKGQLFTSRYLRLAPGVGLYAEVDGADDLPATLLLGGDRRQVTVRRLPKPVAWPTQGRVALALTPTILPQDRCPAEWQPHCRGLAIPGADPVSGWDLAANGGAGAPRQTRWAIRPGAVWHLDSPIAFTSIGVETASGFGWIAVGTGPTDQ